MTMTKTQLMQKVAGGKALESFQYVPDDGGPERHYNITALRQLMEFKHSKGEFALVAMDLVLDFLTNHRVWEMERVMSLTEKEYMTDPAIALVAGKGAAQTHCFVDGVHRIIRRSLEGVDTALIWTFPEAEAPRVPEGYGMLATHDWGAPLSSIIK